MSYKSDKVISTIKKNIILYIILWLIITIVLIAPITYTFVNTNVNGNLSIFSFSNELIPSILKFTTIMEMFSPKYLTPFIQTFLISTVIYCIAIGKGISKTLPKSKYDKIEHGSSDWCTDGEQYKVLSRKSGLILAKENYLPLDKKGNTNVLIVGRIWNR